MATGLRTIWVTLIIVTLFSGLLIGFALQFINQNNPSSPLLGDPSINTTYNSINAHLTSIQSNAQSIQDAVQQDKGDPIMIFLILKSMLVLPWQMMGLVLGGFTDVGVFIFSRVFGGSFLIIAGVVNGILIGTIIFLAVKFIRTGESER